LYLAPSGWLCPNGHGGVIPASKKERARYRSLEVGGRTTAFVDATRPPVSPVEKRKQKRGTKPLFGETICVCNKCNRVAPGGVCPHCGPCEYRLVNTGDE
jgi:hypothetical protein